MKTSPFDNAKIEFQVSYKGNAYTFDYGSQAYIFHAGIYNDMDKKYSIKTLLSYVDLVHQCYLKDIIETPLGKLADYIATNWKKVKNLGSYDILEKFYMGVN